MSLCSNSRFSNVPSSNALSSNAASASSPCSAPVASARSAGRARTRGDQGQTTAEYALVLLGAATIAMLVVTWASSSGAVGSLLDAVVAQVIGAVK